MLAWLRLTWLRKSTTVGQSEEADTPVADTGIGVGQDAELGSLSILH